jgi:hypothetical protein
MRGSPLRIPLALAAMTLLLVAAPAASAASAHRADGKLGDWRGKPTMLAGTSQVSRGELIYSDYLYDDYGADLNGTPDIPRFRAAYGVTAGDYRYPENRARYGFNAADLRELRIASDRRGLHLLIALQTMKRRRAAIAAAAIDTDGRRGTGAGDWPAGVGLTTPGADRFVVVSGRRARVYDDDGPAGAARAAVDLRRNAFEVDVPRSLLGQVGSRARIWLATGLAARGRAFAQQEPGEVAAFDLAFQGRETYPGVGSWWSEERQSDALADGGVSRYGERLRIGLLHRGATRPFRPKPGFYNRIFRSRFSYGEGINPKRPAYSPPLDVYGGPQPMFRGPYQPYGLYIPRGYSQRAARRGKVPLTIDGHSLDGNHNQFATIGTRQLAQYGDQRRSLIITPLARGADTWYLDSGLVDVIEAWRDVRREYGADPDRTSLTGYSMGGYLTYRLGLLMPDAFVRTAVHVGPPAYFLWPYPAPLQTTNDWRVAGNTNLIVENGLNLPYELNYANFDDLVPIGGALHQADTFRQAGNPYRLYHHTADTHSSFILLANEWSHTAAWLGRGRRDLSPMRVHYVRYPVMDIRRAGLVFDGAYWVDGMEVRRQDSPADFGRVDATTFGRGGRMPRLVPEGSRLDADAGGVSPARVSGQHYEPGERIRERNAFEAELDNLAGIEFDSRRMGLNPRRPVRAKLSGDGRTVVRFSGDWPGRVRARLDGEAVPVRSLEDGSVALALRLAPGEPHRLTVRRASRN